MQRNVTGLLVLLACTTQLFPSHTTDSPTIGVASMQGRRPTMEDEHCACYLQGGDVAFYAVYDGHGGPACAKYAVKHLHHNIVDDPIFATDITQACISGTLKTDEEFLAKHLPDGSCMISALIADGELYAINLGDSRAVLCRDGEAKALSDDHKPDREDELKRVKAAGGFVAVYQVPRVGGRLAISRALGDPYLKAPIKAQDWVIATPEIEVHHLDEKDEFLLLACDGVWDVFSNEQAIRIVKRALDSGKSLTKAAKALRDAAYKAMSFDNITVMVIPLEY